MKKYRIRYKQGQQIIYMTDYVPGDGEEGLLAKFTPGKETALVFDNPEQAMWIAKEYMAEVEEDAG